MKRMNELKMNNVGVIPWKYIYVYVLVCCTRIGIKAFELSPPWFCLSEIWVNCRIIISIRDGISFVIFLLFWCESFKLRTNYDSDSSSCFINGSDEDSFHLSWTKNPGYENYVKLLSKGMKIREREKRVRRKRGLELNK